MCSYGVFFGDAGVFHYVYTSLILVLDSFLGSEIGGSHRYSITDRIYPATSPKKGDQVFGKVFFSALIHSQLLLFWDRVVLQW